MLDVVTNPYFIAAVFVVATVVFHVILIWRKPLSPRAWKTVDYLWISCTALSLILLTGESQKFLTRAAIESAEGDLNAEFRVLPKHIQSVADHVCTRTFARGQSGLSNLDTVVSQQRPACDALQATYEKVASVVRTAPFSVDESLLFDPAEITEKIWRHEIEEVRADLRDVKARVSKLLALRAKLDTGLPESLVRVFGPILLALAMALRLTKITGELHAL